MNKQEILKIVNRKLHNNIEAWNTVYRGKTFVVANNRIKKYFKTKRGAESYIKREEDFSYYDDYTQDFIYPNANLEIIEIKEDELLNYKTNKMLWYLEIRNKMGESDLLDNIICNAKNNLEENSDILTYVLNTIEDLKNGNGLTIYECKELLTDKMEELNNNLNYWENTTNESSKEEMIKFITEEIETVEDKLKKYQPAEEKENNIKLNDTKVTEPKEEENKNISNDIEVIYNEEKNGIEVKFNSKPDQSILENLKANGFRWSKYQKLWYAKDTEERRNFINTLNINVENTEVKGSTTTENNYPEIKINDIESYTIDKSLSDKENDNSMFRNNYIDHQVKIQNYFKNVNNNVLEVLENNSNNYYEYKLKNELQRFKKNYYKTYVRMLNHKINNPSWMITGRGGLNVSRYNKKQEQYNNILQELCSIEEKFNNCLGNIKYKIKKDNKNKKIIELNKCLEEIKEIPAFNKKRN